MAIHSFMHCRSVLVRLQVLWGLFSPLEVKFGSQTMVNNGLPLFGPHSNVSHFEGQSMQECASGPGTIRHVEHST